MNGQDIKTLIAALETNFLGEFRDIKLHDLLDNPKADNEKIAAWGVYNLAMRIDQQGIGCATVMEVGILKAFHDKYVR